MITMVAVVALTALVAVPVGVVLGWYLRRANRWCPRCGGALMCPVCEERPTASWYRVNQRWAR